MFGLGPSDGVAFRPVNIKFRYDWPKIDKTNYNFSKTKGQQRPIKFFSRLLKKRQSWHQVLPLCESANTNSKQYSSALLFCEEYFFELFVTAILLDEFLREH